MNRIDKLNSNAKLDYETRKIYNKIVDEPVLLEKSLKNKETPPKLTFESLFVMIDEIIKKIRHHYKLKKKQKKGE